MGQFNIREMPDGSLQQLQDLTEWKGYTKTQAMLIALDRFWKEVKQERDEKMQDIQMKKLIGKDINGKSIIVECKDKNAVARAKREYAKAGIALESYDKAIQEEAERLLLPDDERPAPKYRF